MNRQTISIILAGLTLLASRTIDAAPARPLSLLPEKTLIVTPTQGADAETAQAAALLQEWLRKACRTTTGFTIVGEAQAREHEDQAILALGRTHWADAKALDGLWQDGFVLRRQGNVIAIAGGKERGTFYGAVRFLDRFAGVRFYMPGDRYTSLPEPHALTVGDVNLVEEPFVRWCMMSGLGTAPGEGDWVRRNGTYRRDVFGGTHQHNMFVAFAPEKYAQKYPEIYPILNGARYIPKDAADQKWQPCLTEPKLLEVAEETALEYFQKHPEHRYLAFSLQDSNVVCQCPRCAAITAGFVAKDPQGGALTASSQIYWKFMNALASRLEPKLPGKLLVALAYASTREVPPFKLHPNIMVVTNFHIAEFLADGILRPDPKGATPVDQWLGVAAHYGNHDWYQGNGYLIPRLYTGFWSQFLRHLKRTGKDASFQHAETYANWGLDGPKLYILSRLWWDPEIDTDALLRQYCSDMFGPAAEPMRDYFTRLERLWTVLDNEEGPERKLKRWSTQFNTSPQDRAEIQRCRGLLEQATARAQTSEQKERVRLFAKSFRLSADLFELAAAETVSTAKVEEIRRHFREEIAPDPMTLFRMAREPQVIDEVLKAVVGSKPVR